MHLNILDNLSRCASANDGSRAGLGQAWEGAMWTALKKPYSKNIYIYKRKLLRL